MGIRHEFGDWGRDFKPSRLAQCCGDRLLVLHEQGSESFFDVTAPLVGAEGLVVVVTSRQAVVDEPHQARQDSLTTLGFDGLDDVVIGVRMELHQNLAKHTDPRFTRSIDQVEMFEIVNDAVDDGLVGRSASPSRGMSTVQEMLARYGRPAAHEAISRSWNCFVRTGTKVHLLQQVAKGNSLHHAVDEGSSQGEARVVLDSLQGSCDDRDIAKPGILESLAQQTDVIGGTAHAAGLSKEKGGVIKVVLAGFQCRHELPNDDNSRETSIIVDYRQAIINVLPGSLLQYFDLIARGPQGSLGDGGLVGGELWHQNSVSSFHLFGEGHPVIR